MLMTLTFPRTNDSHRNARNYRIDSQTPENTSHFAMRITLFSSLMRTHVTAVVRASDPERAAISITSRFADFSELIVSKVDYCNLVLAGISGQLQDRSILNAASRLYFSAVV